MCPCRRSQHAFNDESVPPDFLGYHDIHRPVVPAGNTAGAALTLSDNAGHRPKGTDQKSLMRSYRPESDSSIVQPVVKFPSTQAVSLLVIFPTRLTPCIINTRMPACLALMPPLSVPVRYFNYCSGCLVACLTYDEGDARTIIGSCDRHSQPHPRMSSGR